MRFPVGPFVASRKFHVLMRNAGHLELGVEFAVRLKQRILSPTIKTQWRQQIAVAQHRFKNRTIFRRTGVKLEGLLNKLGVLLEVCHRGVCSCPVESPRVLCRESQRSEATHAQARDE